MVDMRRPALLAFALLALTTASSTAHADGTYFSLGMGPGEITDQLGQYATDSFGARIAVGHRIGHLAFEGYLAPEDADRSGDGAYSTVSLFRVGVDAKYILPISDNLQVYVRGGLSKLSATIGDSYESRVVAQDYSGRGLGGGAGVQLRGKVRALGFLYWPLFFVPAGPKVNAAIFAEHGVDFYRLHREVGPANSIDARITRLTIGFNVGADF